MRHLPRSIVSAIACVALALPDSLHAQQGAAPPYPLIVSGDWLASHLDAPRQVVIHAAASRAEYDAGHVPGARLLLFATYAPSRDGLSSQMASITRLDSAFEAVGLNDGDRVIIYGQPLQVSRLLVTLDYVGLVGQVSVLDGGIDAWREAGRPISHESRPVAAGHFTPRENSSIIAGMEWVRRNSTSRGVKILDARAPEFYLGYSPGQMPRAGHIPGATNIPFSQLTGELSALREAPRLSRLFAAAGVQPGDTVVTYCHIGMQASLLYFAARRLGYDARLYDGSWEEWSRHAELPIVTEVGKGQ